MADKMDIMAQNAVEMGGELLELGVGVAVGVELVDIGALTTMRGVQYRAQ